MIEVLRSVALRAGSWLGVLACVGTLGLTACADVGSRSYFRELDAALKREGRLRTDRMARNVDYSNTQLADHFRRTAFGFEFTLSNGTEIRARPGAETDGRLKRWAGPIRYRISGSASDEDRAAVAEFAARLSSRTRLQIADAEGGDANLSIHFVDHRIADDMARRFAARAEPDPQAELFTAWRNRPRWPCAGEIYYQPDDGAEPYRIEFAVIYIRDELEGISRRSCIEEEMSQTLGLARDDSAVRPSIFNDDEEFALLTEHDEYLLRILYDPRLRPGMAQDEAMPIVRRIAQELRPWRD